MKDEEKMNLNITNLIKKIAIISAINFTTLAFDIAMTYHKSSLQVNKPRDTEIYKNKTMQSILNAIKPSCYALAAIGDSLYLTKNDGFVDTLDNDGKVTVVGNDVSDFTDNWYWLLLHLTKTTIRVANLINMKKMD